MEREISMDVCTSCKSLAGAPQRFDVPHHLVRVVPTDVASDQRSDEHVVRCIVCGSHWQWSTAGAWILTLPPISDRTDAIDHERWWGRMGDAITRLGRHARFPTRWKPFLGEQRSSATPDKAKDSNR